MKVKIHPGDFQGTITANASKSAMQRACAAALLRKGVSVIRNPGNSDDDKAALRIIRQLGAKVDNDSEAILITGCGLPKPLQAPEITEINCGESGLSIRMFSPIAALAHSPVKMTGQGSLRTRPVESIADILAPLGVEVKTHNGLPPVLIHGPLSPKDLELDGSQSSQFLTGVLMAYAGAGAGKERIRVNNLKSRPYIDLTLSILKHFQLPVPENRDYAEFIFSPVSPEQENVRIEYQVEGDWSGAAFLLVAGALGNGVTVQGLKKDSFQGDKKILEALNSAGADIKIFEKGISVVAKELNGFEFDATDCPDLFPPLAALAVACKGSTRITGLSRLKHKESDRGATLKSEYEKMGHSIILEEDWMTIIPSTGDSFDFPEFSSHHDHRIAMAVAVSLASGNKSGIIKDADAVNKSYPDFYRHLQQCGIHYSIL